MDYAEFSRMEVKAKNLEERRLDANILCAKCQNGHLMRRRGSLEFTVYCRSLGKRVPQDITECSMFQDAKAMSLEEMNQIAILIDKRQAFKDSSYR